MIQKGHSANSLYMLCTDQVGVAKVHYYLHVACVATCVLYSTHVIDSHVAIAIIYVACYNIVFHLDREE